MVSTLEQMQVPNGTGPGVRRSKRPLLASCIRCNVLWKRPTFGNKVKIGIKAKFGNKSYSRVSFLGRNPNLGMSFSGGILHWGGISERKSYTETRFSGGNPSYSE